MEMAESKKKIIFISNGPITASIIYMDLEVLRTRAEWRGRVILPKPLMKEETDEVIVDDGY